MAGFAFRTASRLATDKLGNVDGNLHRRGHLFKICPFSRVISVARFFFLFAYNQRAVRSRTSPRWVRGPGPISLRDGGCGGGILRRQPSILMSITTHYCALDSY